MELIEKKFYEDISNEGYVDLDTLYSFSKWLQENDDPRSRLVSLELASEIGSDVNECAAYFKGYKNYKSPVDFSSSESEKGAWQELETLREENKRRVLDIPMGLSKGISLSWMYGYVTDISVSSQ